MKIVFMGTPDFAKESLAKLAEASYDIVGVVTNPDRPKGRGMKMVSSPVKEYASQKGINVYQPEKVKNNTEFLEKMSGKFGYKYFLRPAEKLDGEIVSSTAIREYLSDGNFLQANRMLGSNFSIEGTVIKGQQLGKKIGFRTANLIYPDNIVQIPYGVYSTAVTYNNISYKGITNFGIRPTISKNNIPSIETNILGFDEDIYGENISIEFLEMLRPEQKFSSLDKLITQIKFDVEKRQNMD